MKVSEIFRNAVATFEIELLLPDVKGKFGEDSMKSKPSLKEGQFRM